MTLWLKQSTAKVVSFGAFLDKGDGVTEETGLVSALDHGTTGIKLSKNGGALTIRHASVTATTYDAYGMYLVTLDTTDTNTLGTLRMAFNEAATCLPVWQDFMVLPANVYDSLVGGSDVLDVSMIQILGTAVATPATAGVLDVNVKNAGNTAWASGAIVAGAIATGAITNAKFAAGAIDAAAIADNAIDAGAIAADAITAAKIAAGAIDNATFAADVGSTAYATNIIALAADKAIANAALATAANLAAAKTVVDAVKVKTDYLPSATAGAAGGVFIAGENAETTVDFVGGLSGTVGSVTGNVGGNVTGSVGSVVGAVGSVTAAVTLPTIPTNWITANGIAADAIGASELAADAVTEIAAGISIPSAATIASQVRTELTTELGRIDVATSTRLATAGYTAPLDAAGIRTAVGLASANLDTQLAAIDDAVDTEVAAIYSRLGAPAGASMSADIAAVKAETATIQAKTTNLPAAPASTTNITQATGIDITKILGTAISTPATAGILDVNIVNIGGSAADLGATPGMLDVRLAEVSLGGGTQLRANLGLATADLDTQLAALPTAAEAGAATWEELRASHVAAGSFGEAVANVAGSVGGNVDGNVAGSVGSVVGAVGSVTGLTAANLDVAVSTRLADANTQSQVRAALGVVSANLDAQLGAIDDLIDTEVAAIYSRLGAPAGASMSADIAAVKAETATINTATGATAIRTAVGLASANLDTQLGAIDDLLDTEIAAIKAKTDLIPAAPASTTNITAAAGIALSAGERTTLANAILDLADGATTNYTLREALEVMLAVLAGKLSGAATATITIRDVNDTKNVVVATTTASGDRTAVTITP